MLSACGNMAQFGGLSLLLARTLAPSAALLLRGALARHTSHAAPEVQHAPALDGPVLPLSLTYAPGSMWRRGQNMSGLGLNVVAISMQQRLTPKEREMVRLYLAGCFHHWEDLPGIAREYIAAGCTAEELRGCVRHLTVFGGYPSCLAATLALQKAKLLPEDTPAKCGGAPGNAFELVYGGMTDTVRQKISSADPALGEWIRMHLYGDLYSSPGLDLRQKQLLACAYLGQVNMPEQLLGHCIAAFRFGASKGEVGDAMGLGFRAAPELHEGDHDVAQQMLDKAYAKYLKSFSEQHSPPRITVPDPSSIKIPSH